MKKAFAVVRTGSLVSGLALAVMLSACGGGGGTTGGTQVTLPPPPTPSANVTASGAGLLVIHPSLDSQFVVSLETPIRIIETTGGTADWNFARLQTFRKGKEIERYELGADIISGAGFKKIAANQNKTYKVVFRTNQDDFDDLVLTLGFSDLKDGRQFTAQISFGSFSGVDISIIPLSIPTHRIVRLD